MAVSGVKEFEIKADPETVMKAVAAVDRLPEWSSAHKKITIESTHDDGRSRSAASSPTRLVQAKVS